MQDRQSPEASHKRERPKEALAMPGVVLCVLGVVGVLFFLASRADKAIPVSRPTPPPAHVSVPAETAVTPPSGVRGEVMYTHGPVNVRAGRGTRFRIVRRLPAGATVRAADLRDGWYHAYDPSWEELDERGSLGYVSARVLHSLPKPQALLESEGTREAPVESLPSPGAANLSRSETSGSEDTSSSSGGLSISYKLATINAGHAVATSDPTIAEFSRLLASFRRKCHTDPARIPDMLVKAWEMLKEAGKPEGLLELAYHLDEAMPDSLNRTYSFEEVAGLYVFLRKKGE